MICELNNDHPAAIHQAPLHHAQHFPEVLEDTQHAYKRGYPDTAQSLQKFDRERANIVAGQQWAAAQAGDAAAAALLCSVYFATGVNILMLRQHPQERISRSNAELEAANRAGLELAAGLALGNLGYAYGCLGEFAQGAYGCRLGSRSSLAGTFVMVSPVA